MISLILAFVFALGWVPLFVYRAEAMRDALPYYAAEERLWVKLTPAILAAHVTFACLLVSLSAPPPWRAVIGLLLFAVSVGFWFWARAQIGPLRMTRLPDQPPVALRRDGPFAVVRNPLYLGYLGAAAAPAFAAGRPMLFVSLAVCFVALAIRAEQDERRLHDHLGADYAQYCREVKRLIPFVW